MRPRAGESRRTWISALDHVTEGVEQLRQLDLSPGLANGLAWLALIRQARSDASGAMEAVDQAIQVMPGPGIFDPRIPPAAALRTRLLLAQGQTAAAARWVHERGLGEEDPLSYSSEREYLVVAQVLLAIDAAPRARRLLDRLHAAADAQERTGSLIEILAAQALVLHACGEDDASLAALASALQLGSAEGAPPDLVVEPAVVGRRQNAAFG